MAQVNSKKIIISLDLSTSTGYAVFTGNKLGDYGTLVSKAEDFNVNNYPEKSKKYPYNIVNAANEMGSQVDTLVQKYKPDWIIIENTVRGKNRNTQRILEFVHKSVLDVLKDKYEKKIKYLDPSEWRKLLDLKMSKDDLKHNKEVRLGKARGKLTRKHLSVRMVNEQYDLGLKLKDDDIADAICLGMAFLKTL